jgi:hypothetical protein
LKKTVTSALWLALLAWAGCAPDEVDYARPDHLAPQASAQREACPGCEAWRCERYVLEAHNADSAQGEQAAFEDYLACLRQVGVEDPCLEAIPQSTLFPDRFYPDDWRDYEVCLTDSGVHPPQTPQEVCQELLNHAQRAPNEETRFWFLARYEACVRQMESP